MRRRGWDTTQGCAAAARGCRMRASTEPGGRAAPRFGLASTLAIPLARHLCCKLGNLMRSRGRRLRRWTRAHAALDCSLTSPLQHGGHRLSRGMHTDIRFGSRTWHLHTAWAPGAAAARAAAAPGAAACLYECRRRARTGAGGGAPGHRAGSSAAPGRARPLQAECRGTLCCGACPITAPPLGMPMHARSALHSCVWMGSLSQQLPLRAGFTWRRCAARAPTMRWR